MQRTTRPPHLETPDTGLPDPAMPETGAPAIPASSPETTPSIVVEMTPGLAEQETKRPEERPRTGLARSFEVLGKRRQFLVDKKFQLRAVILIALVALTLLLPLNLILHVARERSADAVLRDAPGLESLIREQNRTELVLVLLASVVFLGGVAVVTILETHKTAGASFNIARHMAMVQAGRYRRLRLRRGDNLRTLEEAFNEMSDGLVERARETAQCLEDFADEVERLTGPQDATRLAITLRERARHVRGMTT